VRRVAHGDAKNVYVFMLYYCFASCFLLDADAAQTRVVLRRGGHVTCIVVAFHFVVVLSTHTRTVVCVHHRREVR
jgi:hypothetical protein